MNWYQHRDLARLYFTRSTLLNENGQAVKAAADLDHALKAWPEIVHEIINRAANYLQQGRYSLALGDLDGAAKLYPASYPILADRAAALLGLRDVARAEADVAAALAINNNGAAAILIRGHIAMAKGDVQGALKDYEMAQQIAPRKSAAYAASCLARALLKQDLATAALADCNKALALAPHDEAALENRGRVFLLLGQFHEATEDYDMLLAKKPKNPLALYGRGLALRGKGESGGSDIAAAEAIAPGIAENFDTPEIILWNPPIDAQTVNTCPNTVAITSRECGPPV